MKSSTPITDKSDNCYQSIVQDWSIIIPQDNYLDYDDQNMYTCPNTCIHVFKPFRLTYPPVPVWTKLLPQPQQVIPHTPYNMDITGIDMSDQDEHY